MLYYIDKCSRVTTSEETTNIFPRIEKLFDSRGVVDLAMSDRSLSKNFVAADQHKEDEVVGCVYLCSVSWLPRRCLISHLALKLGTDATSNTWENKSPLMSCCGIRFPSRVETFRTAIDDHSATVAKTHGSVGTGSKHLLTT